MADRWHNDVARGEQQMMRRPPQEVDESAWGKSWGLEFPYPLVRHLLDAAAMALHLWDSFLSDNQRRSIAEGLGLEEDPLGARALVGLCAGLHDIGKLSGFQLCDARGREQLSARLSGDLGKIGVERASHGVAGMEAAPAVLEALGFGSDVDGAVRRVAEIIGGHHGQFHRRPERSWFAARRLLGGQTWEKERAAHAGAVFDVLGRPPCPGQFKAPTAVLVTGVVILADWLVSQQDFVRGQQRHHTTSLAWHFTAACAKAPVLAQQAGLVSVALERKQFREAYDIDGAPNALQRSLAGELADAVGVEGREGQGAGILVVTAAPGDGKSEAALEAERVFSEAFGTRGFAFLLPTMATSDQMHSRVAGALARQGGVGAGLTLTHSMAWLSSAYSDTSLARGQSVLVCEGEEPSSGAVDRLRAAMRPKQWLHGGKRPLLAQYTVGTIDQALMAVLPVRHNALRLLALSGKTFIVDEAHAYDPYMQVLLGRLLNWLGAYGVPVILLSATLPASVSDRLVKEYLQGAGHSLRDLKKRSFTVPYPGWLYVDGANAHETSTSGSEQRQQAAERRMDLRVEVEHVTQSTTGAERERLAVISRHLEPVVGGEGGCALVVCNTVGDAQDTYAWLRKQFTGRGLGKDDIQLLHARFPGDVREKRTRSVTDGMGRSGPRPVRRIIVATQVVEQSLDLDADVVISDLAPLALLLQRAGRCWRHETWWARQGRPGGRERPAWAQATGARLVVLDPLAAGGVPKQWGEVYPEILLLDTSRVLADRGGKPIVVPDEVQNLVEEVHGDRPGRFNWETEEPRRAAAKIAHHGQKNAQESVARVIAVPRARTITGLHNMHHLQGREEEWEARTRLAADSVRLLCVYRQPDGALTLDPAGGRAMPGQSKAEALTIADVRAVMDATIPVRADWFQGEREAHQPPPGWTEHPMLGDLVVLEFPARGGTAQPVTVKGKQLFLDTELGLTVG
ncbi:CRISPR-associated helicase Cas3' [Streptomyces sp. NPDC004111]|uniref:CRISPR-associated helicase Cas3' n=1 Tax=Streptomyces sp. NPDC004111 TaxID=3364690 RepID=UPI003697A783